MDKYNSNLRYALEDDCYAHLYLCHGDGSKCEDGCDRRADPKRLRAYETKGYAQSRCSQ